VAFRRLPVKNILFYRETIISCQQYVHVFFAATVIAVALEMQFLHKKLRKAPAVHDYLTEDCMSSKSDEFSQL